MLDGCDDAPPGLPAWLVVDRGRSSGGSGVHLEEEWEEAYRDEGMMHTSVASVHQLVEAVPCRRSRAWGEEHPWALFRAA